VRRATSGLRGTFGRLNSANGLRVGADCWPVHNVYVCVLGASLRNERKGGN